MNLFHQLLNRPSTLDNQVLHNHDTEAPPPILLGERRATPQDFKDANAIHLYEHKGDRASCDTHRGISLLSSAGNILARIFVKGLTEHPLYDVGCESQ